MKPPGGECHDLFGAAFNGSPSHLRVLKPPGGGSSDIFGGNEVAPDVRRVRSKQQQQTSQLFLGSSNNSCISSSSSTSSSSSCDQVDAPVAAPPQTNGIGGPKAAPPSKLGNNNPASSYQRLFGEYQIPSTPSKNYMKSSIVLDVNCEQVDSGCGSSASATASVSSQGSTPERGNSPRESTKSLRSSPPRNPVTGDGYDVTRQRNFSHSTRKRDGNPVTGEGYDLSSKPSTPMTNGSSNPPSTPSTAQGRQRVPPGGFSSGLW